MARADEKQRGLRDEANVGPDPRAARELRPLKELKWKVTDGEPDVRGWSVYASTGRELGVVHDLLVDTEAGEVVMLDVDLKRGDRHALAPLRAAWIDAGTKRVVVDARELSDDALPGLPRTGALSDDDVSRFNDGYVRAYGNRGVEEDRSYRLRRGDEELHFGRADSVDRDARQRDAQRHAQHDADRSAPRRLMDDAALGATGTAASAAGTTGARLDESRDINRELADLPRTPAATHRDPAVSSDLGTPLDVDMRGASAAERQRADDSAARRVEPPRDRAARADTGLPHAENNLERSVARDLGYPDPRMRDAAMAESVMDDAQRREAAARAAEQRVAAAPPGDADRRTFDRARDDRDADLAALDAEQAIDPRELDARVRIDEGATVDERAPVGGVRYDSPDFPHHDYGRLTDRYAEERQVSRRAWLDDATNGVTERRDPAAEGSVRYRRYDDGPRP